MSNEIAKVDPAAAIAFKTANKHWAEGNKMANKAIEHYMRVGNCLNLARTYFPGDNEFGKYRAEAMPSLSAKWAGDLMRIATRFQGQNTPPVGISVLKEIASASDDVIDVVTEKAEAGEKVTVKQARELVKAERKLEEVLSDPTADIITHAPIDRTPTGTPDEVSGTGASTPPPTSTPSEPSAPRTAPERPTKPAPVEGSHADAEADLLALPVHERLEKADNLMNLLGLSQFADNLPADDAVTVLMNHYCARYASYSKKIKAAYEEELA